MVAVPFLTVDKGYTLAAPADFMAQINIKQLEAFVQVADQKSFRLAASVLSTTQPNISSRMSALEQQLGVKLMERGAGQVLLTPIGERLLEKARLVLRQMDEFLIAAGEDYLFEGVLRLGVTEMVVHSWLSSYLAAFKKRFPGIAVDLLVDFSDNLSSALANRSIDLAFQSEPFDRAFSGTKDLGCYKLAWVAAPSLGCSYTKLSLDDLIQYPILTHAKGTQPFDQLAAHLSEHSSERTRLVPSTNLAACLHMTMDGLGVACLPEVMVKDAIAGNRLQLLNYPWVPDALQFCARYDAEISSYYVSEAAELAAGVALSGLTNSQPLSVDGPEAESVDTTAETIERAAALDVLV